MTPSSICVIPYGRENRPDAALAEAVAALMREGVSVRGLLQHGTEGSTSSCARLFLTDIGQERSVEIFQNRGRHTRGCRLDAGGLAHAAAWFREAIESRPDVLVLNRFGRQEAEGRGLVAEIGDAVVAGLPLVLPVGLAVLPQWQSFSGGIGDCIKADAQRIAAWCRDRLALGVSGARAVVRTGC